MGVTEFEGVKVVFGIEPHVCDGCGKEKVVLVEIGPGKQCRACLGEIINRVKANRRKRQDEQQQRTQQK